MNNNVSQSIASNVLYQRIVKMIWSYPTIYENRSECLNHLFCVIGNGYQWQNGILRAIDEDEQLNPLIKKNPDRDLRSEEKAIAAWEKEFEGHLDTEDAQKIRVRRLLNVKKHNNKVEFRRDYADLLALATGELRSIYPLCEYSCMATVPDDVHPDYLAGIREMIFLIFETPANDFGSGYTEQERELNIKFASNILTQLSQRFPKGSDRQPTSYEEWLKLQQELNVLSAQITHQYLEGITENKREKTKEVRDDLKQITHTVYMKIYGCDQRVGTIAHFSGMYEFISQDEQLSEFWGWEGPYPDSLIATLEAKGFKVEES